MKQDMPAKRRSRGKGRGKHGKSKVDLSSEEMDSQDQLSNITDRLARKRLVKSSTDTEVEQHEQKENLRKQHGGDGYDADFETSEFDMTSAGSDMDCQTQSSKAPDTRPVLSPAQGRNRRNANNAQGNLQKKVVLKQSRQATLQQGNNSSTVANSQRNPKPKGKRQSKRKTCSTDSVGQPSIDSNRSSILKSPEMMFTLPNASDSSTPLSGQADSKSEANDSCFGFEGLISPPKKNQSLPFSPVLPESPSHSLNDVGASPSRSAMGPDSPPRSPAPSLDLILRLSPSPEHSQPSSISSSMLYSMESTTTSVSKASSRAGHKRRLEVNLTGLIPKDQEAGPPKKAVKKKKPRKKKEEHDAWTLKMSAEFDDIEMFELTVE